MPEDDGFKLTLVQIKRSHRALKRAHAKMVRKVETLRKLRTASYQLGSDMAMLRREIEELSDVRWTPPPPPRDY